jgi:hypothetical protein
LLPCLALFVLACGGSSSGQSSTTGGSTSSTGGSAGDGGGGGGGGGCSVLADAPALACSSLSTFEGPGLSASFGSGVLVGVTPDTATIDAGTTGELTFRWSGDDLTTVFAKGDAVTSIQEGFVSQGYTGIQSATARAVVAYAMSNTYVAPPPPLSIWPQLTFSLGPECSWQSCDLACPGQVITTDRHTLVVQGGPTEVTLKAGETATVEGVKVHHGGAIEGSVAESASSMCEIDFLNEVTFTLLEVIP